VIRVEASSSIATPSNAASTIRPLWCVKPTVVVSIPRRWFASPISVTRVARSSAGVAPSRSFQIETWSSDRIDVSRACNRSGMRVSKRISPEALSTRHWNIEKPNVS
jgi:hypothetical protein